MLEDRQYPECLGEGLVLLRQSRERLVGVGDRPGELLVSLAEGVEDGARVADETLQRGLLRAQDAQDVGRIAEERAEVAERVVQIDAAPVDGDGGARLPALEGLPRALVEGVEDLVDLGGVLGLPDAERSALRDRTDFLRTGVGGSARRTERNRGGLLARLGPGGELDVGLAEQRLLPQDRARVRVDGRELRVDLDRRLGRVLPRDTLIGGRELDRLDLPDRDARDPYVGLRRELRRLREVGGDLVALRLRRNRTPERDPQEQDQAEAGQREADRHENPAD